MSDQQYQSPNFPSELPHNAAAPEISTEPFPLTIQSAMSASTIITHLINHGCPNLTNHIIPSSHGSIASAIGGLGDVYQAMLWDGRQVAIKTLRVFVHPDDDEASVPKRAARELYTWSRCRHRNVLPLLGLAEYRGQIRMVSQWMTNGSLLAYLNTRPGIDRYQMGTEVSRGVDYMHTIGIIHGDLKGANVLVSDSGVPVITDFGNAVLQNGSLQFTETRRGSHFTPRWTAPEILEIEGAVQSKEADVYALGMTILEIVTGKVPYWHLSNVGQIILKVVRRELPDRPIEHIPPGRRYGDKLWALLLRCWDSDMHRPDAWDVTVIMNGVTYEKSLGTPTN